MKPFKVEITFNAPVFVDSEYPIHLDALLAFSVVKEAESMEAENAWEVGNDLSHILEKTDGDEWVWKASRLIFDPLSGMQFRNMIRKSDPDAFYADIGKYWLGNRVNDNQPLGVNGSTFKIDTGSGQYRGYQWLAAYQWMRKAEAYGVGDIDAVTHYLSSLSHIGKVGRNGFGRIDQIKVTPASPDDGENWKLRNLPKCESGLPSFEYADVHACLRAPYWEKTKRVVVQEPVL